MRRLLNTSLDALAYVVLCGLAMLVIAYLTAGSRGPTSQSQVPNGESMTESSKMDVGNTTFNSSAELANALRRAATAHGEHERRTGRYDADWPNWYAEYIVREQAGRTLPS
jgi:hypothetical protein